MNKFKAFLSRLVPFNPGKPGTQLGVALLIVLLIAGFATKCHAEESYKQVGIGSTVVRGPAAMIDLAMVARTRIRVDHGEVGATFIGMSELNGEGQRNNFALRTAIVDGFGRFDVGLGVAWLQNVDTYNGSHVNFNLLFGYRLKRWPLTLRLQHFSNGGTRAPNKGRDMLFAAWRF